MTWCCTRSFTSICCSILQRQWKQNRERQTKRSKRKRKWKNAKRMSVRKQNSYGCNYILDWDMHFHVWLGFRICTSTFITINVFVEIFASVFWGISSERSIRNCNNKFQSNSIISVKLISASRVTSSWKFHSDLLYGKGRVDNLDLWSLKRFFGINFICCSNIIMLYNMVDTLNAFVVHLFTLTYPS